MCFCIDKAVNGFSSTGIHPYNPDIFTDEDYAPSSVTENADPNTSVVTQAETSAASSTSRPTTTASDQAEIPTRKRKASNRISQAETSAATKEQSMSVQRPMRTSRNPAITKPRPPSATRVIIRKPAYLQNAKNCAQNIPNQPVAK